MMRRMKRMLKSFKKYRVHIYDMYRSNNERELGDHAVNICDYTIVESKEKHIVFSDDAKQLDGRNENDL